MLTFTNEKHSTITSTENQRHTLCEAAHCWMEIPRIYSSTEAFFIPVLVLVPRSCWSVSSYIMWCSEYNCETFNPSTWNQTTKIWRVITSSDRYNLVIQPIWIWIEKQSASRWTTEHKDGEDFITDVDKIRSQTRNQYFSRWQSSQRTSRNV